MEFACVTDVGLVRDKNQDSYIAINNNYGDFLLLVADGIGGGKAGEVASGELIKYFDNEFKSSGPFDKISDAINYLIYHVNQANKCVYDLSLQKEEYSGMGTTLSGILITNNGTISINCGDSRVYGLIDNMLIHLTVDHTLVNKMIEDGEITYEQSLNHPKRHYLLKAIGIFDKVEPDIHKVRDMDYYLICSDGLHSYVSDEEIKNVILNEETSVKDKVNSLKVLALSKGGLDNITIILVKR